jgi:hypothetical protein
MRVDNVHGRVLSAPVESVRPWLDWMWSGEENDVFPRDWLLPWREGCAGGAPAAWSAGTKFGHARVRFRLRGWDGVHWEADVLGRQFRGEHAFTLEPDGARTRITHRLSGTVHRSMRIAWLLAVRPVHDWAIEAMFDRLEHALAVGSPPQVTPSPMGAHARLAYEILDRLGNGALSGQPRGAPGNWATLPEEMRMRFGCDELIERPDARYFRATSVKAPASAVFRWLCQLRAAPYSYDWIDNAGRPSPRSLTSGLEQLQNGVRFMRIFTLQSFETDRQITLLLADRGARRVFGDLAVSYLLVDMGETSRLVMKLVIRYPRSLVGRLARLVLPWGDLVMARKQLLTLKALAEHDVV